MTSAERMILLINRTESDANNLKELIEFMDTPRVQTAAPGDWRQKLGDYRLEAFFVGPDLLQHEIEALLNDIREFDPSVPIVMMNGEDGA